MKKELKVKLFDEAIKILNDYDLSILIFNYKSTSEEINEIEKKRDLLIDVKHDDLNNVLLSNEEKNNKIKLIKDTHNKYQNTLEDYRKNLEILSLIKKTYKIIIENGLYLICNEFINMIVNNCKNKRDLNEFLNIINDDTLYKNFKFECNFYYDDFRKRFNISCDGFNDGIYLSYEIDYHNNYIWDIKYYDYKKNKNKISFSDQYKIKINNAFKYDTIKNQCKELLKVYHEEISKQYKFILESNKKIEDVNIYNLDGFIKYSVI